MGLLDCSFIYFDAMFIMMMMMHLYEYRKLIAVKWFLYNTTIFFFIGEPNFYILFQDNVAHLGFDTYRQHNFKAVVKTLYMGLTEISGGILEVISRGVLG